MRIFRNIFILVLSPFVLIALLALAIYFPPIQNWVVGKVAEYASEETGMSISVQRVCLKFPLDLGVEGVSVIDGADTIADVKEVVLDVKVLPLLKKSVVVEDVLLDEAIVNWTFEEEEEEDTTETVIDWKVDVAKVRVKNSRVGLYWPTDTMSVGVKIGDATIKDVALDLAEGIYQVGGLEWKGGGCSYDILNAEAATGIDTNHIGIEELILKVDSIYYHEPALSLNLRECSFKEKCGLTVTELTGYVGMDSTSLHLPDLRLRTSASELDAVVNMDLNTFDEKEPGQLNASVYGSVGKEDFVCLLGDLGSDFWKEWPSYPLSIDGSMKGNMEYLDVAGLKLELPTAFKGVAKGWVANISDTDNLRADLDVDLQSYRLPFVTSLVSESTGGTVRIPDNISMKGKVTANGSLYGGQLTMTEGGGVVDLDGSIDIDKMKYDAQLKASNLQVAHFVPGMDLKPFTGELEAKGVGTDFLSNTTNIEAHANVSSFGIGEYALDNINGDVTIQNGKILANIDSDNDLLVGSISAEGFTDNRKELKATLAADVRKADLYNLKVVENPLELTVCGHLDLATDYDQYYQVEGLFSDLRIQDAEHQYNPESVMLDLLTRKDTTHVAMETGDFKLNMHGKGGYATLLDQGQHLVDELQTQFKRRQIDQSIIRRKFPMMDITLEMGKENLVARAMNYFGYGVKEANMDMAASPETGINGTIAIDSLVASGMLIDKIRSKIYTVEDSIHYQLEVENNKDNPDYVFRALVDGEISEKGSDIYAKLYDAEGELGLSLGLAAMMEEDGIRVSMIDRKPILGYKTFTANEDNYIYLGSDQRVYANMQLEADDGTGVQIYSDNDNVDALQDLTVSLGNLDLGSVLSVIPYMPDITGSLNGDFHVIMTKEEMSVSSNVTVDNMVYEKTPFGNVGTEFVYMPKADGSHYVDGILMTDGEEVASIQGTYYSEGEGSIDATVSMERMPLQYLNGFLPNKLVSLQGYGDGSVDVKGSLSAPVVNGELMLDSSYVTSPTYGVKMRFADVPVRIVNSQLLFENFVMYSDNDSPLTIDGELDFTNLDNMTLDIEMMADNFMLINAKKTRDSEAYGKAYVNFRGRMMGPVASLSMFGKLDVLGSTDMTYILKDSELTTDTQLDELVKFVDFSDTTTVVVQRQPLEGFSMRLAISVDEQAHILCGLNSDLSNYIDLMGGGDLTMYYSPAGEIELNGRYTLNDGVMKYSLPVIPLKTFNIEDGSYVEFTGEAMNPTLNITATENVKANVDDGSGARTVDFQCGVKLTQTLNQPGIQFIISAPDDVTTQDELNTMDDEERGKIAITMLASGMYLASGNTASFSMNSALTSYLNSEINNIMGSAMRSVGLDVSVGVDNSTTSTGDTHTDYNFKFSKRLWNNRLNVSVGGQVSSGADLDYGNSSDSFFDNVELEYRLDKNSSMYIKAFYDNSTYDWLEGLIGEYGAGFVWKRKLQHFKDIFKWSHTDK